ncbi:MAG: DNA repair protein RadA [Mycobacteriales bacterium]
MPKLREGLSCTHCGVSASRWTGRCHSCGSWDTIVAGTQPRRAAVPITGVDAAAAKFIVTGLEEFDRVLGGGLVPGSVTLLAGDPGVGKSTLALDIAARVAARGARVLVVTAEESAAAVRLRAQRIGALQPELWLAAETELSAVEAQVGSCRPRVLVLDSVQTVLAAEAGGAAGGVTQVREVAARVGALARSGNVATVLVGHVAKDGTVAGPRSLEHMVDVVLTFEGEPTSQLRLLRATKNRFGSTEVVGCFELVRSGVSGVADPAERFVTRRTHPVAGTCVTVALDGRRALAVEVQALVGGRGEGGGRRASSGLDAGRFAVLLAIAERRGGLPLAGRDVYSATVGGARILEPAADLAVMLAIASSASDSCLAAGTVAIAEVGLTGELRAVSGLERRLAEAARLGFTDAIVPADSALVDSPLRVHQSVDLADALTQLLSRQRPMAVIAG